MKNVVVWICIMVTCANAAAVPRPSCEGLLSRIASHPRFQSVLEHPEYAGLYAGFAEALATGFASDIKTSSFQVFLKAYSHKDELRIEIPIIHVHPSVTDAWTDHTGRGLDLTFAKILFVLARFIHDELARNPALARVRISGKFVLNPEVRARLQDLGFRRMHQTMIPYLTQGAAVAAILGTAYYLSGGAKDVVVLGLMASTLYTMLVASSVTQEMWVAEMGVQREPGHAPRLIPID